MNNLQPCIKLPNNPIQDINFMKSKLFDKKSLLTYKPTLSKCGLGQKQGTQGTYKGIQFDSYWEFAFYLWCTEIKNYICIRNTTDSFKYTDSHNKVSNFYPDFKVNGEYYEIKGVYRQNDLLKKDATLGLVNFIGPTEIKPIIQEVYKKIPSWKDRYQEGRHHTKLGRN